MGISAEHRSKFAARNGEVSLLVKNCRVGRNKQTNKQTHKQKNKQTKKQKQTNKTWHKEFVSEGNSRLFKWRATLFLNGR